MNAVRSPMAEGLLKQRSGREIFVDSVGAEAGEIDPFVVAVMQELDVDLSGHVSKSFEDLDDTSFDLIITLSPAAHAPAEDFAERNGIAIEHWEIDDPTTATGSREQRLEAYRQVRDDLRRKIEARFGPQKATSAG